MSRHRLDAATMRETVISAEQLLDRQS